MTNSQSDQVEQALSVLREGGVLAYPAEYCFGLGCDPRNVDAIRRILSIKQRQREQGLILLAANLAQIAEYADLDKLTESARQNVIESWPGPNTWLLPLKTGVSEWVHGSNSSIAMRISEQPFCFALCSEFNHPIVSTSANRHGQPACLSAEEVSASLGDEVDFVVSGSVSKQAQATTIRNAITGETIRA